MRLTKSSDNEIDESFDQFEIDESQDENDESCDRNEIDESPDENEMDKSQNDNEMDESPDKKDVDGNCGGRENKTVGRQEIEFEDWRGKVILSSKKDCLGPTFKIPDEVKKR